MNEHIISLFYLLAKALLLLTVITIANKINKVFSLIRPSFIMFWVSIIKKMVQSCRMQIYGRIQYNDVSQITVKHLGLLRFVENTDYTFRYMIRISYLDSLKNVKIKQFAYYQGNVLFLRKINKNIFSQHFCTKKSNQFSVGFNSYLSTLEWQHVKIYEICMEKLRLNCSKQ